MLVCVDGPQVAEALDRQLPLLAALGVHGVLEAVHRDLTEHGGDLTFEALGEQREARRRVGRLGEEATERHGLAEHRCRLGQRQRRRLVEDTLRAGEVRVDTVAELVREGEHVAAPRRPVQQDVGWCDGTVYAQKAPGRFPGRIGASIHGVVEEASHDVGDLRRERRVGVEHEVTRVRPTRTRPRTSAIDAKRS